MEKYKLESHTYYELHEITQALESHFGEEVRKKVFKALFDKTDEMIFSLDLKDYDVNPGYYTFQEQGAVRKMRALGITEDQILILR